MTEIEIDVKAKIFDDPDYCENKSRLEKCFARDWINSKCWLFNKTIKFDGVNHLKHEQCKEAWKTKKDEILT